MKVIYAPNQIHPSDCLKIFLAGSIEMGAAENWQDKVIREFEHNDVTFFNPRRPDWDSSWGQSIDDPRFVEQVEWELDALESADDIFMYFDPNTKSPISLLEFGLYVQCPTLWVCCPSGFWRKGNVDVTARWYDLPVYEDLDEMIAEYKSEVFG